MGAGEDALRPMRFGVFEVDLSSGELRRQGIKVKLQEQPFQVLVALLERPGAVVTREELHKRIWPHGTFVDFDGGLNKAIKKLRDAIGDHAESPRFIETVPQRGYRFIAPVETGAGGVLVPSPELVPSRQEAGASKPISRRRWLAASLGSLGAVALLTLALKISRVRNHILPERARPQIDSLAVLPLQNLSQDPQQEYFSDGMTDELVTELAKTGSLRVISRTSTMRYKDTQKSIPRIATELGVDAVVTGTVLRAGNRVRITVQLILASDDRHLWSERYERDVRDVLMLQDELTRAIVGQIRGKLSPPARSRPVNPHAYEAYLKGTFFGNKPTEANLYKSIQFFTQATELDPAYAPAYAGLSQAYCYLGILGLLPSEEVYPKARTSAMKAIALDETSAEAHNVLADIKKGYEWNWAGAEAEYKRAIEHNPSHFLSHAWYADYLSKMGRHEDALEEARRGRQLDPISVVSNTVLGMILYRARRYDEAISACQRALELEPRYPNALWFQALAHQQAREFSEAVTKLRIAVSVSDAPLFRAALGHAYALAGDKAQALSILNELKALASKRYVSPLDIALVHTGLGERDYAFKWLEKACQERTMRIQEVPQPHFDSLRSDPRFHDLLRRIGLPG